MPVSESSLFSFLETLVDRFGGKSRGGRPLPQTIGEGIAKLAGGDAAAVYMVDKNMELLVPEWVSAGFPALTALPRELAEQGAGPFHPSVISFLKLSPIPVGDGPVGRCFQEEMVQVFAQGAAHGPLLLAPLRSSTRTLGVVAISRGIGSERFPQEDLERFRGLATQSGFALGMAVMQEEAAEKRRMESELLSAREVQRLLLPESAPVVPGFDVTGRNLAARIVSGDYYDFIPVDANHTGLVIADVSGKGIPASLMMATCRGLLRGLAPHEPSPSRALATVNRSLFEDMKEDMFISAAYVMLRSEDGMVTLCRAGHDAPLLYRKVTGKVERLEPPGLAMGVDEGDVFDRVTGDFEFKMESGDCLLLYTDGINEAEDAKGNEFGMQRLEQTFGLAAAMGAESVVDALLTAVAAHLGKSPQNDDVTLVAVVRR